MMACATYMCAGAAFVMWKHCEPAENGVSMHTRGAQDVYNAVLLHPDLEERCFLVIKDSLKPECACLRGQQAIQQAVHSIDLCVHRDAPGLLMRC